MYITLHRKQISHAKITLTHFVYVFTLFEVKKGQVFIIIVVIKIMPRVINLYRTQNIPLNIYKCEQCVTISVSKVLLEKVTVIKCWKNQVS